MDLGCFDHLGNASFCLLQVCLHDKIIIWSSADVGLAIVGRNNPHSYFGDNEIFIKIFSELIDKFKRFSFKDFVLIVGEIFY